ncbi:hypothetical protein [Nonomuraea longicatena]|uniref:hypothetical protein n=1 Tax=Nonomuraea longicatena TaxID=83682 RepID=UPI0031D25FD5
MSDLYRISIDGKTGSTVRGRVHIIHPDAEEVPEGEDFALRMILEVWDRARKGHFFVGNAYGDDHMHLDLAQAQALAEGAEFREEFERLQVLDEGLHVVLTEEENAAAGLGDDAVVALGEKYGIAPLRAWGSQEGRHYIQGRRDGRAFYSEACRIVTDYEVGEMCGWPPHWELSEEEYKRRFGRRGPKLADLPYAEFTFTVKDARYVEHLEGGIHFASAIFGEWPWFED